MTFDFAERGAFQCGQRFLDGSAPRLIPHVTFCETAAGDIYSPTAGKDQKPSRGVGQSPTVFARAARVVFLSLSYYRAIETARFSDRGKVE